MVLLDERRTVLERHPEVTPPKSFWNTWGFWAILGITVGALLIVFLPARVGEVETPASWMPEYEVDTLAIPEVAARTGGPVVDMSRYHGGDANLDPDMPLWWMPEYEIDTLANPEVAANTGGPLVEVSRYHGGDANLDPDVH